MIQRAFLTILVALAFITGSAFGQQVLPINSGVVIANMQNGNTFFKVSLTANVTSLSIIGQQANVTSATIIFQQDNTGGRTVTFASNITGCTVTGTANASTVCVFTYDPATASWFGTGGGSVSQQPGVYSASSDPPLVQNYTVATAGQQPAINLTAAPIDTQMIQWRPSGNVTSCSIQLDTSADGVTWNTGAAIPAQKCVSAGQQSASGIVANYVAVNVTSLAGGGTLTVEYAGRLIPLSFNGASLSTQVMSFGTEINTAGNNGANQAFIVTRPFTANYVSTSGSMYINPPFGSFAHISTATSTQVRTGAGFLNAVTINTTAAGAITIFDNSACSGTTIGVIASSAAVGTYQFQVPFSTGLCITTAAASDLTVSYNSGSQFQCLVQPSISRGGPPRYTGTGSDVPVGLPNNSLAQFSGVLHDPSNLGEHGQGNADAFHSLIMKAFMTGTALSMFPNAVMNTALNGYQLSPGDWFVIHQDCDVPGTGTGDTEVQITFQGTAGPVPQYVQWFSDNFTRANENPLCFNGGQTQCWWFKNTASPSTAQIVSNRLQVTTASSTAIYYFNVGAGTSNFSPPLSPSGTADQYGEITIATSNASCGASTCNAAVALRFSNSALTGYLVDLTGQAGSAASWAILKDNAGAISTLASGTGNIPVGSILRGEIKGSTLTAKVCTVGGVNPVCTTLGSVTDASFTTGQVGVYMTASGTVADSQLSAWDAGSINF